MSRSKVRRHETPCLLCKQPTRDWDHVCGRCRRDAVEGKSLREHLAAGDQDAGTVRPVAWYWQLGPWTGNAQRGRSNTDIIAKLVLELAGARETTQSTTVQLDTPIIGAVRHEPHSHFIAPTSSWTLVEQLVQAVRDLVAWWYQDGKRDGEGFIRQLAAGEISMDKLQDRFARREE